MRRSAGERFGLAVVVAVVVAFAILPAADLFVSSLARGGGAPGLVSLLLTAAVRDAFGNSLLQGGLSAGLAVAVGYPAGVFLGRYRWPGRETVRAALLVPFLLPGLVMVLGLLDLVGPQGIVGGWSPPLRWFSAGVPGIVAVNLFYNVPIVVLLTATGCEAASPALEEAVASLGGSPARAYRDAWAAPSWAGAACGGLITFVFSALSFAPPILLCGVRCDTLEVNVYRLALVLGDPVGAGLLAVVLVGAFLLPAIAYVLLVRRLAPAAGRPPAPRSVPWRSPIGWGLALEFASVVGAEAALVGAVLVRSVVPAGGGSAGRGWALLLSPALAARTGITAVGALENTLFFASLAAGVGLGLALASAFVAARRPSFAGPLALLLFVPVLLSPVVLAEGLATFWRPLLGGPTNVWVLIVLSQALLGLPFAAQSLEIPLAGLPAGSAESAATLGATSWGAFTDVELPRLRRGLQTAVLFAFALGLGEFTATYFLVTPQFVTLPVAVFALASDRLYAAAGAAAALLLVLSAVVFGLIAAGGRDRAS
jgi:thiamine transport system permease protein